ERATAAAGGVDGWGTGLRVFTAGVHAAAWAGVGAAGADQQHAGGGDCSQWGSDMRVAGADRPTAVDGWAAGGAAGVGAGSADRAEPAGTGGGGAAAADVAGDGGDVAG